MSLTTAMTIRTHQWVARFVSVLGGAIIVAGFWYACLFVVVTETCHPRYCRFGVIHRSILSGGQILAIYAHPADPPFSRLITNPYGLTSLMPLVMGGIALLICLGSLFFEPPCWLLLLTLTITAIGLFGLLYDTVLFNGGITSYSAGFVFITTITPLASAGHTLLYLGYMLLVLGTVQRLRHDKRRAL